MSLTNHKSRLQNKIKEATKKLVLLNELDTQSVANFTEVKAIKEFDSWYKSEQSGDDWITHYQVVFYEAETDNGTFRFSIDYTKNNEKFYLKVGQLSAPNTTKEQIEMLYDALQDEREHVVLLHDYLDLNSFLKICEVSFVCINNETDDWYEKDFVKLLTIGHHYAGYIINKEEAYVQLKDGYHYLKEERMNRFFRIEKKNL